METAPLSWKNVKAVPPGETVGRIRTILESCGLHTGCRTFGRQGICNSARIFLTGGGCGKLDIGTNGKGMDEGYALASAYAELMERLQNKMLLFTIKYASPQFRKNNPELAGNFPGALSFRYFPDEEYRRIDGKELSAWAHRLIPKASGSLKSDGKYYDMPFLPFYNVRESKVEDLPYDMIRFAAGSTGLCAGNIPEEAILQGLNEIFERHVLQQIYVGCPSFPEIDLSYFRDTAVYDSIMELSRQNGWQFVVKDCSLGGRFPVIGLGIGKGSWSPGNLCTFRLGADRNPVIALQRCLSEIFQGTDIESGSENSSLSPFRKAEYTHGPVDVPTEYRRNMTDGRGLFPPEIFRDCGHTDAPAWHHDRDTTIEENFARTLRRLEDNGYELFIRDNSFLGFPSYHLYIPGLSDVDGALYDISKDLLPAEEYYKVKPEYRLNSLGREETESLICKYRKSLEKYVPLFGYVSGRFSMIDRILLLTILSVRSGNYDNAAAPAVKIFLEKIKDLPLPQCFDCTSCQLRKDCFYQEIIGIESKIQALQLQHPVDQSRIGNIVRPLTSLPHPRQGLHSAHSQHFV